MANGTENATEFSTQKARMDTEMDTEGYHPTYDEAFPELPTSNAPILRNPGPAKATNSGSMQSIRASTITQVMLPQRGLSNLGPLFVHFFKRFLIYSRSSKLSSAICASKCSDCISTHIITTCRVGDGRQILALVFREE